MFCHDVKVAMVRKKQQNNKHTTPRRMKHQQNKSQSNTFWPLSINRWTPGQPRQTLSCSWPLCRQMGTAGGSSPSVPSFAFWGGSPQPGAGAGAAGVKQRVRCAALSWQSASGIRRLHAPPHRKESPSEKKHAYFHNLRTHTPTYTHIATDLK